MREKVKDLMCGNYPKCGLSYWACNELQSLVYEEDTAKRRVMAVEIREDMADTLRKVRKLSNGKNEVRDA